jgi:hypothetical protein
LLRNEINIPFQNSRTAPQEAQAGPWEDLSVASLCHQQILFGLLEQMTARIS